MPLREPAAAGGLFPSGREDRGYGEEWEGIFEGGRVHFFKTIIARVFISGHILSVQFNQFVQSKFQNVQSKMLNCAVKNYIDLVNV